MSTLFFDIEVAYYPEITRMAIEYGVNERRFINDRFGPKISVNLQYITHISFKRDKGKVVNLSVLDGKHFYAGAGNEKNILERFISEWNLSDEVVAFYGEKFDLRFLNSRIEKYKLPMLKPVRFLDPWKVLRKKFLLADNKLDTAIKFFKCPYEKPALPWTVWQDVSKGAEKAIKLLRNRCKYDVLSMAWLWYEHLAKYSTGRSNKALVYENHKVNDGAIESILYNAGCPNCGVKGKLNRRGYLYNKTTTGVRFQCKKCHEWCSAPLKKSGSIGLIR